MFTNANVCHCATGNACYYPIMSNTTHGAKSLSLVQVGRGPKGAYRTTAGEFLDQDEASLRYTDALAVVLGMHSDCDNRGGACAACRQGGAR